MADNGAANERLIWIDLEMTGLDTDNDSIIEIATVVTDAQLNVLAEGPEFAIHHPLETLEAMDEWNRNQHRRSGLWQRVVDSTVTLAQAEAQTVNFLAQWIPAGLSPMCGNSICQDRRFLHRQMPRLEKYFHYRNLDVSTVKELAKRWAPTVAAGVGKNSNHTALSDVHDSIAELRHYRQFMGALSGWPTPGPVGPAAARPFLDFRAGYVVAGPRPAPLSVQLPGAKIGAMNEPILLPRDIAHDARDWSDLQRAVALLEAPTLTARMANLVGTPLEFAVKALPSSVSNRIHGAVQAALTKSAQAALWSMDNTPGKGASTRWHKLAAATSGAVGGAFGFAALFIELPVSTTIMMRAVADVARSEGFDLSEFSTRQACLEVFALGGNSPRDDASETGYYLARGFTTDVMRHLSAELAGRVVTGRDLTLGVAPKEAGKLLAKMVEKVAARFGVVVTEKFAAQAVPIVGAAAGATLNTMFTDYYQDMARGHFIVRRLERKYGEDVVRTCYDRVAHGGALIEPTL